MTKTNTIETGTKATRTRDGAIGTVTADGRDFYSNARHTYVRFEDGLTFFVNLKGLTV